MLSYFLLNNYIYVRLSWKFNIEYLSIKDLVKRVIGATITYHEKFYYMIHICNLFGNWWYNLYSRGVDSSGSKQQDFIIVNNHPPFVPRMYLREYGRKTRCTIWREVTSPPNLKLEVGINKQMLSICRETNILSMTIIN